MEFKNAHLTRQSDLIPSEVLSTPITVIGAGAIGSFLVFQLAKMGMSNITVLDPDVVSIENMSCQLYGFSDCGTPKALALQRIVQSRTHAQIQVFAEKWRPVPVKGIVVMAVDDMAMRQEIFEDLQKRFGVNWFIDTRMGAETALMYVMNPHNLADVNAYKKTLYSNEDALQEPCTAKSTMYTATMLSGIAAKAIKNLICKQAYPRVTQWSISTNELQCFTKEQ